MKKEVVLFLCNRLTIEMDYPIQLNSFLILDKASKSEILDIQAHVNKILKPTLARIIPNPFELASYEEIIRRKKNKSYLEKQKKADIKDWHYWVIRHNNEYGFNHPIEMLLKLIDSELIPIASFEYLTNPNNKNKELFTVGFKGFGLNQIHDLEHTMKETSFTKNDLAQFKKLEKAFSKIEKKEEEYDFILSNIFNYRTLLRMPVYEDLRTIGKFAIIESLLTTRKSIQYESITHQIKNKIFLLNNRFNRKLEFSKWFKGIGKDFDKKKIIGLLYDYRSCIAHGTKPDFKKKLKLIENAMYTERCIDEICRKCLMQSILEPDLIKDLRYC